VPTQNVKSTIAVLAASLFISLCAAAEYAPKNNKPNPIPVDAVGVFMANGVFDPADTAFVPPTGADFDRVIMGRNAGESEARRLEAVEFFIERYGIDLTDGVYASNPSQPFPDAILSHAYQDPRWNYRAFQLPDRASDAIPSTGLIVHDAQWVMVVTNPAGLSLGGSWGGTGGTVVPSGTVAVDGEYLVQATRKFKQGHPRNFYARFQSTTPIISAAVTAGTPQGIKFDCRIFHERLGTGVALGRQEIQPLANGSLQVNIGNVLQFPAPQWAQEQDTALGAGP